MQLIGSRIQVVGPSCAGKSTLAEALAARMVAPFVELDALFWKPNWTESGEEEFAESCARRPPGTVGCWPGTIFGTPRSCSGGMLKRSFGWTFRCGLCFRGLSGGRGGVPGQELLWGTNYERFWPQLKFWSMESLIGYVIRRHKQYGERLSGAMREPRFGHIQWVRLRSKGEVERWVAGLEGELRFGARSIS